MSNEDFEMNTGFRPVFHYIPNSRNMAQTTVMPLGTFYSPFATQVQQIKKGKFPTCVKCKGALCQYSTKDRQMGKWLCNFCRTDNPLSSGYGNEPVQQSYEGKYGESGLFFIVDLCMSQQQLDAIKQTIRSVVQKLPENIFVGLMAFNSNIMMTNFQESEVSYVCFSGDKDYSTPQQISEILGVSNPLQMNQKVILNKYYVPLVYNRQKLISAIEDLTSDSHVIPRDQRYKRATGAAFQVATSIICSLGINTRFVSIISGPCTIGPGKVVQLPIKQTIRVYMDIVEGNSNAALVKPSTKFYQAVTKTVIDQKCTFDIWSYGLDQFGLLQMKDLVNNTGGILAMHEQFNHYIFKESFQRFYEPNQSGMLNFPFACTLRIRVSKQMRINGILGTCKSLKQNTLKTAAQMQIGQGLTNQWYLGGISFNNSLCIILSNNSDIQNKQKNCVIQAITTYKYSDNILRTKVSTITLTYLKLVQYRQMMQGFDQNAAAVMLARMASRKSQIQDISQVKKWLDRILLKFCVKFANFSKGNKTSFRLRQQMRHFPQFMYHLRRSSLVNHFGSPPDQAIYMRTCLLRESLPNCMVMIQSALFNYSADNINEEGQVQPEPVELDFRQMKDQAILLMDSYFTVIVWFGQHIYDWKQSKMNQDPQYQYLNELFQAPMRDASQIMYDRLPISNFYQTFKNDGKQRYLKARVNPATSNQIESDGHFVTDDASISVFMDFLMRSVVNYSE